jgi:tetratricopeptide (TPR) repeat protein
VNKTVVSGTPAPASGADVFRAARDQLETGDLVRSFGHSAAPGGKDLAAANAWFTLGQMAERSGDARQARGYFEKAALLQSGGDDVPFFHQALERLYRQEGAQQSWPWELARRLRRWGRQTGVNFQALAPALKRALGDRLDWRAAYEVARARRLERIGEGERARRAYVRVVAKYPDYAPALCRLGALELARHDRRHARQRAQTIAALPTPDVVSLALAGQLFNDLGDHDEAARLAVRALEKAPDSAEAQITLGWAHYHRSRFAAAGELFCTVIDKRPENSAAMYGLACCLESLGKTARAGRWLRRALANGGDKAGAAFQL